MANAILAQVQSACLDESRVSTPGSYCNQLSVYARSRRGRTLAIVLPDPVTQDCGLVSLVAPDSKSIASCIPEKILGIAWDLSEDSSR